MHISCIISETQRLVLTDVENTRFSMVVLKNIIKMSKQKYYSYSQKKKTIHDLINKIKALYAIAT